jgi:hypothetical protein
MTRCVKRSYSLPLSGAQPRPDAACHVAGRSARPTRKHGPVPGRTAAADRAIVEWTCQLRRHNALLDAEVTAPPGPRAAVLSSEHDWPGADPGPCYSRGRSQRLAPATRKARR